MKAALIPPYGQEWTALRSTIHLALPIFHTRVNPHYEAYLKEARRRDHFIILDNGCAEDELVDGDLLSDYAGRWRVNEIVLPDAMSDAQHTLELTDQFMTNYGKALHTHYRLMGVLQGGGTGDFLTDGSIQLLEAFSQMGVDTIGIPKVRVRRDGDTVRLEIAQYIDAAYPGRFKIHLLGLSKAWPAEMYYTSKRYNPNSIRSMDSAAPYKLAEAEQFMTVANAWAPRRPDYFTKYRQTRTDLIDDNINIFLDWATG
jgi:hypothetical protein